MGVGELADQGGLARVGVADQADLGDELEFEGQLLVLALGAQGVAAGGSVGGGLEVQVAQAAAAALRDQHALAVLGDLAHQVLGISHAHHGAAGDLDDVVLAAVPVAVLVAPVLAVFGAVQGLEIEVEQRVGVVVAQQENAATVAAVAPGGAAELDVLLTTERRGTVPAVAGRHADLDLVLENNRLHRVLSGFGRSGPFLLEFLVPARVFHAGVAELFQGLLGLARPDTGLAIHHDRSGFVRNRGGDARADHVHGQMQGPLNVPGVPFALGAHVDGDRLDLGVGRGRRTDGLDRAQGQGGERQQRKAEEEGFHGEGRDGGSGKTVPGDRRPDCYPPPRPRGRENHDYPIPRSRPACGAHLAAPTAQPISAWGNAPEQGW